MRPVNDAVERVEPISYLKKSHTALAPKERVVSQVAHAHQAENAVERAHRVGGDARKEAREAERAFDELGERRAYVVGSVGHHNLFDGQRSPKRAVPPLGVINNRRWHNNGGVVVRRRPKGLECGPMLNLHEKYGVHGGEVE